MEVMDSKEINIINVTIRDKPIAESREINEEIKKWAFYCLLEHVKETKRLCELKLRVQKKLRRIILQRYFEIWKGRINEKRILEEEKKEEHEFCDEKKIESFVEAIMKKQEHLKTPKQKENEYSSKKSRNCEDKMNLQTKTVRILDPFLQNRLNMQKKIINEQRLKLVEQNRMIEDMKLKQIEKELHSSGRETLNSAEKVLRKCGKQTRNTLMKLMKEDNGEVSDSPRFPPDPPKFLMRMEARAERRRERAALAKEEKRKKLEEQKRRDEALRKEEEEKQRRLQFEIQRNLKRIHEEQERRKLQETERIRVLNELASSYRKRYLLRNYIMNPFLRLIEEKYNHMQIASNHYINKLLKKTFGAWKEEMEKAVEFKINLCTSLYNKNIVERHFFNWIHVTREEVKKSKSARVFYSLRLQGKYLRTWYNQVLESRMRLLENEQIAGDHFTEKIKSKYLRKWKKYVEISEEVNESDKRKEKWRELIQHVIPDFSPKYRGVLSD